eukprot:TRINITY_DN51628_c0_g1_i1.p1 TRINITY_DN51628_c0_g1~~TRINITY_DN51628_c0_g1_i1.p1  ORF type:complete len:654 (+),score=186.34 TRINITY_DN51628_c0_g1_i1:163-2124(+)
MDAVPESDDELPTKSKQSEEKLLEREMECIASEMETRLRGLVLNVMRPALEQMAEMATAVEKLQQKVDDMDRFMKIADQLGDRINQNAERCAALNDLMIQRDKYMEDFELKTHASFQECRNGINRNEAANSAAISNIRRLENEVARLWDETSCLHQLLEDAQGKLWDGIASTQKRADSYNEQLMDLIRALQKEKDLLVDELFGHSGSLVALRDKLEIIDQAIAPIPILEQQARMSDTAMLALRSLAEKCTDMCRDNAKELENFRKKNDQQREELQQSFALQCNQLTAHHASVLAGIRADYTAEIDAVRVTRKEISDYWALTEDAVKDVSGELIKEARRIDIIHKELKQDKEELAGKVHYHTARLDKEVHDLQKSRDLHLNLQELMRTNMDYLGRLVGLVLESERVANALITQDFVDRRQERWLDPSGKRREIPHATPSEALLKEKVQSERLRARGGGKEENFAEDDKALDMKHGNFMMYPDRYKPGQVAFQGNAYDRRDMLLLHSKLLEKASYAYECAPSGSAMATAPKVAATVSLQPGAQGGSGTGAPSLLIRKGGGKAGKSPPRTMQKWKGDTPAEDDRWSAAARCGSSGQPQAIGSRGFEKKRTSSSFEESASGTGEDGLSDSLGSPVKLPQLNMSQVRSTRSSGAKTAR